MDISKRHDTPSLGRFLLTAPILRREKEARLSGGLYHKLQIELAYNSNHIEGSQLTRDQTRYIYETATVLPTDDGHGVRVADIAEAYGHFRAFDAVIDQAEEPLTEEFIKYLHTLLFRGSPAADRDWFQVGKYKTLPNEVGDIVTTPPENVPSEMSALLEAYEADGSLPDFADIVRFHAEFERIHPFQDGNGRVGRLIMVKECLRAGLTPVLIPEKNKAFYYRGLAEWAREPGYLLDTCRAGQDIVDEWIDYFLPDLND